MPEKYKGGGYPDFLTPLNKGPKKGDDKGQPGVANITESTITPHDPLGVIPGGGKKGKGGKKIGM